MDDYICHYCLWFGLDTRNNRCLNLLLCQDQRSFWQDEGFDDVGNLFTIIVLAHHIWFAA